MLAKSRPCSMMEDAPVRNDTQRIEVENPRHQEEWQVVLPNVQSILPERKKGNCKRSYIKRQKKANKLWLKADEARLLEITAKIRVEEGWDMNAQWPTIYEELRRAFPTRTINACKYVYYRLRKEVRTPGPKSNTMWKPVEDDLLASLRNNKYVRPVEWADISTQFPGRTESACRQRHTILKSRGVIEGREKSSGRR